MTGGMKMFARVLVWAGIAAPDVAARQAHAQVRPRALTEFVALLAFAGCQRLRLVRGLRIGGQVFTCVGDSRGAVVDAA
jgi:hypothetical protein